LKHQDLEEEVFDIKHINIEKDGLHFFTIFNVFEGSIINYELYLDFELSKFCNSFTSSNSYPFKFSL